MSCFANVATGYYDAYYGQGWTYGATGTPYCSGGNWYSLGHVERAHEINMSTVAEDVMVDAYGPVPVDAIYRGNTVSVAIALKEYSDITVDAYWPYDVTQLTGPGNSGALGRCLGTMANPLKMVARSGTTAYTYGPQEILFYKAVLQPEHTVTLTLGNVQRVVMVVFRIMPIEINASLQGGSATGKDRLRYFEMSGGTGHANPYDTPVTP